MISKKVPREQADNFGHLARYISAATQQSEKLHSLWMVNCNAGETRDDLDLAIMEIEATQERNTRAQGAKTYHLIISF